VCASQAPDAPDGDTRSFRKGTRSARDGGVIAAFASSRIGNTSVPPILSAHIDETIRSIAQLHAEHHENATPLQRTVDRMTALLGRPRFLVVLTLIVVAWISLNLLAASLGYRPIDSPFFSWLGGAVSLTSLYMVVLILATQQRQDQLAHHRELLILELAIVSEQKTAKVIQLLEEFRRDDPHVHNRVDQEAEAMAQPADPRSVLDAIKDAHARTEDVDGSADRS
jgi:uncharacterized membrane protein